MPTTNSDSYYSVIVIPVANDGLRDLYPTAYWHWHPQVVPPMMVWVRPFPIARKLVHLLDVAAVAAATDVRGLAVTVQAGRLGVPRALEGVRHGNARREEEGRGVVRRLGAAAGAGDTGGGELAVAECGGVQVEH